ncbi:MAG: hypothetical protein CSA15_01295 [Candidatus Delongbacteria bacterium]|nr:MAG: hypothetical protein CSA15_01295 [Candidatus Delongbacteria bacterium]
MDNFLIALCVSLVVFFTILSYFIFKLAMSKGGKSSGFYLMSLSVIRLITLFVAFIILRGRYELYYLAGALFCSFILSVITEMLVYKFLGKSN